MTRLKSNSGGIVSSSTSLENFSKRMLVRATNIEGGGTKIARKLALQIDSLLINATPFDTARALSNWLVGVSSPRREDQDPYQPGNQAGSVNAAIQDGLQSLANVPPGAEIWISNNVPYINPLNEGHSPQKGPRWIEASIETASRFVFQGKVSITDGN